MYKKDNLICLRSYTIMQLYDYFDAQVRCYPTAPSILATTTVDSVKSVPLLL
nr:hypothetical protein [Mucilaginibacter sp. X4EP1]